MDKAVKLRGQRSQRHQPKHGTRISIKGGLKWRKTSREQGTKEEERRFTDRERRETETVSGIRSPSESRPNDERSPEKAGQASTRSTQIQPKNFWARKKYGNSKRNRTHRK
jgi:hypothetical protein